MLLLEAAVLPVHRPWRLRHDSLDQSSVVARVDGVLEYVVDLPQLLFQTWILCAHKALDGQILALHPLQTNEVRISCREVGALTFEEHPAG